MKILVDMNLSPRWCSLLRSEGWDGIHWSTVGSPSATGHEIMNWALSNDCLVLTHDLDFGAMLAATRARGPSVIQVRTHDVRPQILAPLLIPVMHQYLDELAAGALLVVDEARSRIRLLPLS